MFLRMGVYLVKFERYYHTLREAQISIDVTAHSCKLPSVQRVCCIVTLTDTLCRQDALIDYRDLQKTVKGIDAGRGGGGA